MNRKPSVSKEYCSPGFILSEVCIAFFIASIVVLSTFQFFKQRLSEVEQVVHYQYAALQWENVQARCRSFPKKSAQKQAIENWYAETDRLLPNFKIETDPCDQKTMFKLFWKDSINPSHFPE